LSLFPHNPERERGGIERRQRTSMNESVETNSTDLKLENGGSIFFHILLLLFHPFSFMVRVLSQFFVGLFRYGSFMIFFSLRTH